MYENDKTIFTFGNPSLHPKTKIRSRYMKRFTLTILLLTLCMCLFSTDYLTIYNNNQALYRSDIELQLKKGVQFIPFENIPTGIITESVTFIPTDKNLSLYSQNYEYDLANSHMTIQKYINKNVRVTTEKETFSGTLIFFDGQNYGLLNETTKELNVVSSAKVTNVLLTDMPTDFYTKPTLRWQLASQKEGKFAAKLSYLTSGIEWRATYNVILEKNDFTLASWVTINNRSGKDYENVTLKLIAGDVQTYQTIKRPAMARGTNMMYDSVESEMAAPAFEEREFADYRIFTLDKPADIDNNQEKQLSLYPLKTITYTRKYEYPVQATKVDIKIDFKNTTGAGLPAGNINFYEIDDKDKTQQFVGVNRIGNTSLNQDVSLKIGSAFDVVGKTTIKNQSSSGRSREIEYEVTLTNNKSEAVDIEVIHNSQGNNIEILRPSATPVKKDANTYVFTVRQLATGKSTTITFTERTTW